MTIKLFEVGGCVRDSLLGIASDDIDFAVVAPSFTALQNQLKEWGCDLFQIVPEFLTIKAKFPKHLHGGIKADFVLCRKERGSSNARHPDEVEPGTLFDDLERRDFTVNAIARSLESGELFDPHGGATDLSARLLRCVGNPDERFEEDSLRVLRALRFSITKGFRIDDSIRAAFENPRLPQLLQSVSVERRREELGKAFSADSGRALRLIAQLPEALQDAIFGDGVLWLQPTSKGRK